MTSGNEERTRHYRRFAVKHTYTRQQPAAAVTNLRRLLCWLSFKTAKLTLFAVRTAAARSRRPVSLTAVVERLHTD